MSSDNKTNVFAWAANLVLLLALKFSGTFGWLVSLAIHAVVLVAIAACVRREPPPPEKPTLIDVTLVELPPAPPAVPEPAPPPPPVKKPDPPKPEVKKPDPPKPEVKKPDPPKPEVKKPDPPKPVVVKKPDPPKPVVVKKPDPPKPKQPSLQERMRAAQAEQKDKMAEREKQAQAERRRREQIETQRRAAEQRRREDALRQLTAVTTRTNTARPTLAFSTTKSGANLPTGVSPRQLSQYQRYMGLVEVRLAPLWEELGPTGLSGMPSDVTVQLTVRPDGTVVARLLSGRSDNAQMNAAAQRFLKELRRLPAFSEAGLSVSTATIVIEFPLGYSRENRR